MPSASDILCCSKMSEEESASDSNTSIVEVPSPSPGTSRRPDTLENLRKRKGAASLLLDVSEAENDAYAPSSSSGAATNKKKKVQRPNLLQELVSLERPLPAQVGLSLPAKRGRKRTVKKVGEACTTTAKAANGLKQKSLLQTKICDLLDKWCEKHKELDNTPKMGLVPIIFP